LNRCHNILDLRKLAKKRLPAPMFHYLDGGSDDEQSLRNNSDAFNAYHLLPRTLVDVSQVDLSTEILGQKIDWPVILAPTGMSRLFHYRGERAVAAAAQRAGTLYSLSTLSTTSIEDVAALSAGPKMFQIYVHRDRGLTRELMDRCRAARFNALCLTVDVPVAGNRERDFYTGMSMPPRFTIKSLIDIALHPRWVWGHLTQPKLELANLRAHLDAAASTGGSVAEYVSQQFDPSVTWKDAEWMISEWDGPFAIKGILCADDAERAADAGASAIIISNHGGRQLDSVPAPIDLLAEIKNAVGDRLEIILDGGVRRGTHVLKALAQGANACMIGRAYLYGLGAGGEAGVDHALGILREELERGMALMGCTTVAQLTPQHLSRTRHDVSLL